MKLLKEPRILSIGDLHGRQHWKVACFGSLEGYEEWRTNCDDPNFDISKYPISRYDLIIFIGDYLDSFRIALIDIKRNLEEIIHFKLKFLDKVVLLLGNHDVSYLRGVYCDGYQAGMRPDYYQLLNTKHNREPIFQAAYQYKDWLWSHAGVTLGFYEDIIKPLSNPKSGRFWSFYKNAENMAEILNFMFLSKNEDIYKSTRARGGWSKVPGPFWAHGPELNHKPAFGLNQVVGHTPQDIIRAYDHAGGRYEEHPIKLFFIDNFWDSNEKTNQVLSLDFSTDPVTIEIIDLEIE